MKRDEVKSGADLTGAIFVGTCACIAGADPDRMKHLPFTEGMKNEVVVQSLHNTGWTRQCEAAGARMIEVEYPEQMERSLRWVAVHTVHEVRHHNLDVRRQLAP